MRGVKSLGAFFSFPPKVCGIAVPEGDVKVQKMNRNTLQGPVFSFGFLGMFSGADMFL